MQRQLPLNSVLTVAYVAHRGYHAWQVYDINEPTVGALLANPGVNVNALRPYKGFAEIQEEESVVSSMYNGFQLSWDRRFSNGSSFGIAYTLSKSMDNGSNYRDIVPDTYNTSNLWGPSEYDVRHIVIVNYIYQLPFFKDQRSVGQDPGGWEIGGAAQFQTGTPCGIGTNNDFAGVGEVGSFGCGSEGQFWVLNGPVTHQYGRFCRTRQTPVRRSISRPTSRRRRPALSTCSRAFATPSTSPASRIGTSRSSRRSPFNERTGFQFRAEAYDFTNHPNLERSEPESDFEPVREITGKTGLVRNLQLSLRFYF